MARSDVTSGRGKCGLAGGLFGAPPVAERRHNIAPDVSPGSGPANGTESRRDGTTVARVRKTIKPAASLPALANNARTGHPEPCNRRGTQNESWASAEGRAFPEDYCRHCSFAVKCREAVI